MKGYFDRSKLHTLNRLGTDLPSHCDMTKTPGIDMTAGSLGQGLSAAVGMAIAGRLDRKSYRVYCALGDGECQEGQVWEAAMLASQHRLSNLIAFVDHNKMQIDGWLNDINAVEPLERKWEAFGWSVQSASGHDIGAIAQAIERAQANPSGPSMIVLHTTKGRGVSFAEGKLACHSMPVTAADVALALKELA
jgi:transketolase